MWHSLASVVCFLQYCLVCSVPVACCDCSAVQGHTAQLIQQLQPDIVVFGHSHKPACWKAGGVIFINPGSAGMCMLHPLVNLHGAGTIPACCHCLPFEVELLWCCCCCVTQPANSSTVLLQPYLKGCCMFLLLARPCKVQASKDLRSVASCKHRGFASSSCVGC